MHHQILAAACPPDLCIYHAGCTDGSISAAIVLEQFPNCKAMAFTYHKDLRPEDVQGKKVIIVDFSFKGQNLYVLRRHSAAWFILDHHASALPLKDEPNVVIDMTRSGAQITWDTFHPGEPAPPVVQHVQDYDLWHHKLEDTMAVIAGLSVHPIHKPQRLIDFLSGGFPALLEEGRIVYRAAEERRNRIRAMIRRINIAGFEDVPVVNCPRDALVTDKLGEEQALTSPFFVTWYQEAGGRCKYSIRSNKANADWMDVSFLALCYGGGGHENSAGFVDIASPGNLPYLASPDGPVSVRELWERIGGHELSRADRLTRLREEMASWLQRPVGSSTIGDP